MVAAGALPSESRKVFMLCNEAIVRGAAHSDLCNVVKCRE